MSTIGGTIVDALLDTLIPGDERFPAPSALGMGARLSRHDRFSATLTLVLNELGADFAKADVDGRISLLKVLEAKRPDVLGALVVALYSLYYTDETILGAIAQEAGYEARPPQPAGYALKPFDPAVVAIPASRKPHYRPINEASNDH